VLSRSEDWALLLGRIFVAALFLPSGFGKLMAFSAFASSLAAQGVPYPLVAAGVMVAAEFVGALALILGLWPRWTALALIALIALIALTAATLWATTGSSIGDLVMRPGRYVEFYERLAVLGGLLFYFASGPGGWSRTGLR
jgi:putative oxidoreductase